jgi:Fe2+ transport system protein B
MQFTNYKAQTMLAQTQIKKNSIVFGTRFFLSLIFFNNNFNCGMLASRDVSSSGKSIENINKKLRDKLRPPRTKEEIENENEEGSEQAPSIINFTKPQECVEEVKSTTPVVSEVESSVDQEKDKLEKENENKTEIQSENGIVEKEREKENEQETDISLLYDIISKQTASVSLLFFLLFFLF